MSLRAVLRDSIRSDGTRAIKIRIQKNRDVTYINTGLSIAPEKFDQKKGQARDSYAGAAGINAKISALLSRYNQTLELFEGRGAINDVKKIRDLLLSYDSDGQKYIHSTESTGFFFIASRYISSLLADNRDSHASTIISTINTIKKFYKNDTLYFEQITPDFLRNFKRWFVPDRGKEISFNKHLRNIKLLFNEAIKSRVINRDVYPFDIISIPSDYDAPIRELPAGTIAKIYKASGLGRDMFMLSFFFCGMNLKDIFYLPKSPDGYIDTKRFKTSRTKRPARLRLKILPEAQEIICRYQFETDSIYLISTKFKNYRILNSAINQYLKKLCKEEDVPHFSYTWARHSWATIASELGISDDIIDKGLMHSPAGAMIEKYRKYDYSKIDAANRSVMNEILRHL